MPLIDSDEQVQRFEAKPWAQVNETSDWPPRGEKEWIPGENHRLAPGRRG